MIPHGINEKVSGFYLVTEILEKNLITFPEDAFLLRENFLEIKNVTFSKEIKLNKELCSSFREVVSDFLHFTQFIERNPSLEVYFDDVSEELKVLCPFSRFSGMTFLLFFSKGLLHLEMLSKKAYILYVDERILNTVPFSEEILKELFISIMEYAEEEMEKTVMIFPKSGKKTEDLFSGLSVTYQVDTNTEKAIMNEKIHEGTFGSNVVTLDKNVKKTLETLSDLFSDLSENKERAALKKEDLLFTFDKQRLLDVSGLFVQVPDSFSYRTSAFPEKDFVMWLPNEENKEEPEASVFSVSAVKCESIADFHYESEEESSFSETGIYTEHIYVRSSNMIQSFLVRMVCDKNMETELLKKSVRQLKEHIY